ncbi:MULTISPECIES: helix-turn-helix domain-containing protein [Serratia]|uniref:helix-turn-helix domain-containing protein n=1 Tax=Serratia TaxID=613 RepID=UPI0006600BC5|nr:helix-turn-helix domain-containing protein [Serratia sp. 506_PEND]
MSKRPPLSPEDLLAAQRLKDIWNEKKTALRLTQDIAADMMGFSTQASVSHYINGRAPLNTDAVIKFAELLRVKPEDIRPELKNSMDYVRVSGSYDEEFDGKGWRLINDKEAELLNLFEILPEVEQSKLIENLRGMNQLYNEAFEKILASKNRIK